MRKSGLTRGKTWMVSNAVTFAGFTTAVGGRLWVSYPEDQPAMAEYIVRVPDGYAHPHTGDEVRNLLVKARVPRGLFFLSAEYRLRDKPHRVFWIESHAAKVRQEGTCPEGGAVVDQGAPPEFAGYPMCDLCASAILWEQAATDWPGHWGYR